MIEAVAIQIPSRHPEAFFAEGSRLQILRFAQNDKSLVKHSGETAHD